MPKFVKKLLKTGNEYHNELVRAHLIIAFLSLGIIMLLSLGANHPITFDGVLSAICVILLGIVTVLSLYMALSLSFKKKK